MTDELDLLSSLNPIPEVRGNPGPIPSPGEVFADTATESGWVTSAPSSEDIGRRHRARHGLGGRSRWALGVIGLAAAVVVVVGIVVASGDDPGRRDQVLASIDDPPQPGPGDSGVAEPDDPATAEEAPPASNPVDGPTEDPVATDETIPWPDPIVIEVTPETASADRIVEVPAGVVVLEIRGSGWETRPAYLQACTDYAIQANGAYYCAGTLGLSGELVDGPGTTFSHVLAGRVDPGDAVILLGGTEGPGMLELVRLRISGDERHPTIWDRVHGEPDTAGAYPVSRLDMTLQLAGAGWSPHGAVIAHFCEGESSPAMGTCRRVGSLATDEAGELVGSLTLSPDLADLDATHGFGWIVGSQGDRLALMGIWVRGPQLGLGGRPAAFPTSITIEVTDLRAGEVAEVRTCRTEGPCNRPIDAFEIVGTGNGSDRVDIEVTARVRNVALFVDGAEVIRSHWADMEPTVDIPPGAPPATITVEPDVVSEPGTYDFVVRGEGWLVAPPVFVLPCTPEIAVDLIPGLGRSCDTSDLTPVTPVDGAFEVTVTYDVGADGMVIAAGDAAQTQSAIAAVAVG